MHILEKLLGGVPRVKLIRLFLFNPETAFDTKKISDRAKVSPPQVRKEVKNLEEIGLIRKKTLIQRSPKGKAKKVDGYILDNSFIYVQELRQLVLNTSLIKNSEIIKRLQKSGKIKLAIVAGLFMQNSDSRLDLFVVGDGIKKHSIDNAVKILESEVGKELRYVWFDTEEFRYRLSMYDKLIRDILDFPHEKILNRLGI